MEFIHFIMKEGLIMIPVLFIIGEIIIKTNTISNKWIPVILLLISVILTPLLISGYTPENIIQGVLVAGATVFGDQLIKQTQKREWQ